VWEQGSYRLVLLVDHRERIFGLGKAAATPAREAATLYEDEEYAQADAKDKASLTGLAGMFDGSDVEVDRKALPAGDFVFVARRDGEEDVMLDTIIERKREDDFFHSVKDSRLMGQKVSSPEDLKVASVSSMMRSEADFLLLEAEDDGVWCSSSGVHH
jgi:hypothetical protein